jgi:molybdopterin synthase catalytic subunit
MHLQVQLTQEPILLENAFRNNPATDGARFFFSGHVRAQEKGQTIQSLNYEAYPPMALKEMERLAQSINLQHPVSSALIIHRFGLIPITEAAILILVTAPHRHEAFEFIRLFMDKLKQDVPIWKTDVCS